MRGLIFGPSFSLATVRQRLRTDCGSSTGGRSNRPTLPCRLHATPKDLERHGLRVVLARMDGSIQKGTVGIYRYALVLAFSADTRRVNFVVDDFIAARNDVGAGTRLRQSISSVL